MTDTATPQGSEYDVNGLRGKAVAAKNAVAELAGEVGHYASDRFGKFKSTAGEKLHDANEGVADYVKQNPYKTIAIAAGIGLALGLLLKRR